VTRTLLVAIAALLLAVQVVRNAVVNAWTETHLDRATAAWRDHPTVALATGMLDIANSARERKRVDPETVASILAASRNAPLRAEPFLVRGVDRQIAGDLRSAERAFDEAKWREGRSLPARYFLAQRYFDRNDERRGLAEFAVLARLVPDGALTLAPYIATYARNRANWPMLRSMFAQGYGLADATLVQLSRDPAGADAVLALAGPPPSGARSEWLPTLLNTLVGDRQYVRSRHVWASRYAIPDSGRLLFDPDFRLPGPPPPFNWWLASTTAGLAERQRGGGLHVISYGQEEGALVGQLLLLKPGTYRLVAGLAGETPEGAALQWRLTCAPTNAVLASAAIAQSAAGWTFVVPGDCAAQRLELFGIVSEIPQQSDVRISRVDLRQVG